MARAGLLSLGNAAESGGSGGVPGGAGGFAGGGGSGGSAQLDVSGPDAKPYAGVGLGIESPPPHPWEAE